MLEPAMTSFRIDARRNRRRHCDRCGAGFEAGYTWPGLGVTIVLCDDCTHDIEESVSSYGESGPAARQRLLDRLRDIDIAPQAASRQQLG